MEVSIPAIVDRHLQKLIGLGLNMLPHKYSESEMIDPHDNTIEWKTWSPVASKVTDQEIQTLENEIGYLFPESYKIFLKHQHFYELNIADVSFAAHIVDTWQNGLKAMVFDGNPKEFLIDKGLIPFANYSDWGLLCFNATKKAEDNEYEILLWDHERWDEVEFKFENFTAMLVALDAEDDALTN